jgi:hypothetical protein
VLPRIGGYDNKMMYEQCMILHRVMFRTQEVKVGHGKKATMHQQYVYNSKQDDIHRNYIDNSLKYYKDLWNSENTKKQ